MSVPTTTRISTVLGIDKVKASAIRSIMLGATQSAWNRSAKDALLKIDALLGNHGVEAIYLKSGTEERFLYRNAGEGLLYSNTGETYAPTVIFNCETGSWSVGDWGTRVENGRGKYA